MDDLLQTTQKRLERLDKYVAKIDEAVQALEMSAARGDMESLNEEEIRYYLSTLPQLIADSALFLAKTDRALSYAKLDLKVIQAQIWKEINARKEDLGLSNAKDREAYVVSQPKYIEAQRQVFEWEYNRARAEVVFNRYSDLFIGVRKLCGILPQYENAQLNYSKYNQEG